jgi:hypothetical protein
MPEPSEIGDPLRIPLVSIRRLHRAGRTVFRFKILRPQVLALSVISAACLSIAKARGASQLRYIERSLIGMSGEIAFHFLMKLAGAPIRTMLPSLKPGPVDHVLTLGDCQRRIQTKAATFDGSLSAVPLDFKLQLNKNDRALDWYAWCIMSKAQLDARDLYVTLELVAFAPKDAVYAMKRRSKTFPCYVLLRDVPNDGCKCIANALTTLSAQREISQAAFLKLTAPDLEVWMPEALDLLESPDEAYGLLGTILKDAALRRAVEKFDSGSGRTMIELPQPFQTGRRTDVKPIQPRAVVLGNAESRSRFGRICPDAAVDALHCLKIVLP